jgi:hypothetical protein
MNIINDIFSTRKRMLLTINIHNYIYISYNINFVTTIHGARFRRVTMVLSEWFTILDTITE